MRGRAHIAFVVAAIGLLVGKPLAAAPLYDITISSPNGIQILDSLSPLHHATNATFAPPTLLGDGTWNLDALAAAGPGFLRGLSRASLNLPSFLFNSTFASAQEASGFALDNITFSAPGGTAPGTLVHYTVNLALSGTIGVSSTGSFGGDAGVSFNYGTSASSVGGSGVTDIGSMSVNAGGVTGATGFFAGFPTGAPGEVAGISPEWVAREGDIIKIFMRLSTFASLGAGGFTPPGSAIALSDFSHTVLFSPTGPVFNFDLPGWTANSSDGCIVDNQFLCAPLIAVTEPTHGAVAVVSAFFVWVAYRRRRGVRGYSVR